MSTDIGLLGEDWFGFVCLQSILLATMGMLWKVLLSSLYRASLRTQTYPGKLIFGLLVVQFHTATDLLVTNIPNYMCEGPHKLSQWGLSSCLCHFVFTRSHQFIFACPWAPLFTAQTSSHTHGGTSTYIIMFLDDLSRCPHVGDCKFSSDTWFAELSWMFFFDLIKQVPGYHSSVRRFPPFSLH